MPSDKKDPASRYCLFERGPTEKIRPGLKVLVARAGFMAVHSVLFRSAWGNPMRGGESAHRSF